MLSGAVSILMIVEAISLDAFVVDGDLDDGVVLGVETAVDLVERSLPNESVLKSSDVDVQFVLTAIEAAIGLWGRREVMIAVDDVDGDVGVEQVLQHRADRVRGLRVLPAAARRARP